MSKRVCAEPGCPLVCETTRCPAHTRILDRARGTRQARGYDSTHDTLRAQWQHTLEVAGPLPCQSPTCLTPTVMVYAHDAWHLGHTDDRTSYFGVLHARCNLADAARSTQTRTPPGR